TNNCSSSVAVSGSCIISVTFTAVTTGSRSATMTIVDNSGTGSQTVPLSGTGATVVITAATGGTSISADRNSSLTSAYNSTAALCYPTVTSFCWTSLTGPTINEGANRVFNSNKTITLSAPSGFVFDTGTPTVSGAISRSAGAGTCFTGTVSVTSTVI